MELNGKFSFHTFLTFLFVITFTWIIIGVNSDADNNLSFEVNGFYLDDMLSYSPARLENYFNSTRNENFTIFAAEANRPQELQCPSINVISTRYRCKVGKNIAIRIGRIFEIIKYLLQVSNCLEELKLTFLI